MDLQYYEYDIICINVINVLMFSLIRLEFNHLHLQYYAELDAVCLHGIRPRSSRSNHSMYANGDLLLSDPDSNHQSSRLDGILDPPGSKTAEILARGFAHLHVSDGLSAALDVSDNGYFDALPVSLNKL